MLPHIKGADAVARRYPRLDVKLLWSRAAGLCSFPGCRVHCVDENFRSQIGEIAHISAHSPSGPRGGGGLGKDCYENWILLCANHHRLVDSAPEAFDQAFLGRAKSEHESWVARSLGVAAVDVRTYSVVGDGPMVGYVAHNAAYGPIWFGTYREHGWRNDGIHQPPVDFNHPDSDFRVAYVQGSVETALLDRLGNTGDIIASIQNGLPLQILDGVVVSTVRIPRDGMVDMTSGLSGLNLLRVAGRRLSHESLPSSFEEYNARIGQILYESGARGVVYPNRIMVQTPDFALFVPSENSREAMLEAEVISSTPVTKDMFEQMGIEAY